MDSNPDKKCEYCNGTGTNSNIVYCGGGGSELDKSSITTSDQCNACSGTGEYRTPRQRKPSPEEVDKIEKELSEKFTQTYVIAPPSSTPSGPINSSHLPYKDN